MKWMDNLVSTIKFKRTSPGAIIPQQQRQGDAGYDLHCKAIVGLESGQSLLVGTGVAVAIPNGYVGFLCPRSGNALKKGVTILNSPGIIDSNYRDEIKVLLYNTNERIQWFNEGDRIAQLVIVPCVHLEPVEVDSLPENVYRGLQGFGSSGN